MQYNPCLKHNRLYWSPILVNLALFIFERELKVLGSQRLVSCFWSKTGGHGLPFYSLRANPFTLSVVAVVCLTEGADLDPLDPASCVHQDEHRLARLQPGQRPVRPLDSDQGGSARPRAIQTCARWSRGSRQPAPRAAARCHPLFFDRFGRGRRHWRCSVAHGQPGRYGQRQRW